MLSSILVLCGVEDEQRGTSAPVTHFHMFVAEHSGFRQAYTDLNRRVMLALLEQFYRY